MENKNTLQARSARRMKSDTVQKLIILGVLIIVYLFFYWRSTSFRKYTTFVQICTNMYYVLLISIGVTFPLITGGNDLSMGTGLICYSVIGSYLIRINGWGVIPAIIVTILMGVVMGTVNGVIVAKFELPPFIVTLSSMMFCRGMGAVLTNNFSGTWPNGAEEGAWFRDAFKIVIKNSAGKKMPVPVAMIWLIVLVLVMEFVLKHTRVGRYIIAIGSNKEALKLSGVNVFKWHVFAYVISGFFTGLAAVAYAATFPNITPGQGAGLELNAIGSAIIGGTAMSGGSGSVVGTLLGVLLISVLQAGLPYVGLNADWQLLITGVILMAAVTIDKMREGK